MNDFFFYIYLFIHQLTSLSVHGWQNHRYADTNTKYCWQKWHFFHLETHFSYENHFKRLASAANITQIFLLFCFLCQCQCSACFYLWMSNNNKSFRQNEKQKEKKTIRDHTNVDNIFIQEISTHKQFLIREEKFMCATKKKINSNQLVVMLMLTTTHQTLEHSLTHILHISRILFVSPAYQLIKPFLLQPTGFFWFLLFSPFYCHSISFIYNIYYL